MATVLSDFLALAASSLPPERPRWLESVQRALETDSAPETRRLARRLGLNPAWLARAYKAAAGEGLHVTARRRRVERALRLLRTTDLPSAFVAVDAGFCDQSHMHRAFRAMVGRTPLQVRAERDRLGYPSAAAEGVA
jgi:AraC family transcriptional regulator